MSQEEGSSATDCVTDVTDVRKNEEGIMKSDLVIKSAMPSILFFQIPDFFNKSGI
ncbi:hypothetical protein QT972_34150 [Microcoleus sp. herbarium7]|uniref:hypothetical protein n=1 Tax=unclassified Microcoleus TaxID=2642155 RepID=UPI002FD69C64